MVTEIASGQKGPSGGGVPVGPSPIERGKVDLDSLGEASVDSGKAKYYKISSADSNANKSDGFDTKTLTQGVGITAAGQN